MAAPARSAHPSSRDFLLAAANGQSSPWRLSKDHSYGSLGSPLPRALLLGPGALPTALAGVHEQEGALPVLTTPHSNQSGERSLLLS